MSDRVSFVCNGEPLDVAVAEGESLLSVLRERLGITSAKDGCAPQGQCGCCTVMVDGEARVACVTPAARVAGRSVTTVEGLDADERTQCAAGFVATGGSQCGFCTPGVVMRAVAARRKGRVDRIALDRALAAHLCRCTGWQTIYEAIERCGAAEPSRDVGAAARRAALEAGVAQRVDADIPLGHGRFADDEAPRDALVAVPLPPGSSAVSTSAAGVEWVVADSLLEARARAAKVQGRRTTVALRPPISLPIVPTGGVALATGWVEPAYLEPDASWCIPGGDAASPLANGGAFGGKESSLAPVAARELADRLGRPVRVVYSREDVVRLGPKRPPIAATARFDDGRVEITGRVARAAVGAFLAPVAWPYALDVRECWEAVDVAGPPVSATLRATALAERTVLIEGALDVAGVQRASIVRDERVARIALDACARVHSGALAGAGVLCDPASGRIEGIRVRVAAGDPLDEIVLRSYAIGAAHMALGWVLTEGLAVDPESGEVHDLTVRSFGVIRAKDTPPIDVQVIDDPGAPLARSSDAVFAAVAAATWNAIAEGEGARPEAFPARETRAARTLRR